MTLCLLHEKNIQILINKNLHIKTSYSSINYTQSLYNSLNFYIVGIAILMFWRITKEFTLYYWLYAYSLIFHQKWKKWTHRGCLIMLYFYYEAHSSSLQLDCSMEQFTVISEIFFGRQIPLRSSFIKLNHCRCDFF